MSCLEKFIRRTERHREEQNLQNAYTARLQLTITILEIPSPALRRKCLIYIGNPKIPALPVFYICFHPAFLSIHAVLMICKKRSPYSNPRSSIKTIKLDELHHRLDDIILLDIQRRIFDLHCDQLINQPSQPRHQNTDTGPSAEAQPAINHKTAALGIQVNGTREKEEGVGVEC